MKRCAEAWPQWLRHGRLITNQDGDTGMYVTKALVALLGDNIPSNLALLRRLGQTELHHEDGSPALKRWEMLLFTVSSKTFTKGLPSNANVTVQLIHDESQPIESFGRVADAMGLGASPSCQPGVQDDVRVNQEFVELLKRFDGLVVNPTGDYQDRASLRGNLVPIDDNSHGKQIRFLYSMYAKLHNLLRGLLRLGSDDKGVLYVWPSAKGAPMVSKINGAEPITEVDKLTWVLFDQLRREKAERREKQAKTDGAEGDKDDDDDAGTRESTTGTECLLLRDFLFYVVSLDNVPRLIKAAQDDVARSHKYNFASSFTSMGLANVPADQRAAWFHIQRLGSIAAVIVLHGFSQTLLAWAQEIVNAVKSTLAKRANGDFARFPGYKGASKVDQVTCNVQDAERLFQFLRVAGVFKVHGRGVHRTVTLKSLREEFVIASTFVLKRKFRGKYLKATEVMFTYMATFTAPQVSIGNGKGSTVGGDPGVRVFMTTSGVRINPDGGISVTTKEYGKNFFGEKDFTDIWSGQKISVEEELELQDRLQCLIGDLKRFQEERKTATENSLAGNVLEAINNNNNNNDNDNDDDDDDDFEKAHAEEEGPPSTSPVTYGEEEDEERFWRTRKR
jgi:hypothetical protein